MARGSLRDDPAPSPVPQPAPEGTVSDGADEAGKNSWSSPSRRAKQVFGVVAALVGLLVGVTALVDWIGEQTDDPKPEAIGASFTSVPTLQLPHDRLSTYLLDTGQELSRYSSEQLREEGMRFTVDVQIQGLQGEEIPLRWRVYTEGGRPVSNENFEQSPVAFTPENQNHSGSAEVWVPYPFRPGRYVVRFTLVDPEDPEGEPLRVSQPVPFTGEA